MATEHFDLVIYGASPAALATAALVAKRRRRVLLALPAPATGADGQPAAANAFPGLPGHVTSAPHVRRILQALHLQALLAPVERGAGGQAVPPRLQLVTPQLRLDIPGTAAPGAAADGAPALQALQAAFPRQATSLAAWVTRLGAAMDSLDRHLARHVLFPPSGLGPRLARAMGQGLWPPAPRWLSRPFDAAAEATLFAGLPADPLLRRLLLWPTGLFSAPHPGKPVTAPVAGWLVARRLWQAFFSPMSQLVDLPSLCRALLAAAERLGVRVCPLSAPPSWQRAGRQVAAVALPLGRHQQQVGLDWAVADAHRLDEAIAGEAPRVAAGDPAGHPTGSGWSCWQVTLPAGYLPALLGPRTWLLTDAGGPVQVLRRPVAAADTHAPAGDALYVTDFSRAPAAAAAEGLPAHLATQLAELLPFTAPHWQVRFVGPVPGAAAPDPPASRRPRNLLHCGGEVLPGWGLEGEFVAAARLTELLARRARWGA